MKAATTGLTFATNSLNQYTTVNGTGQTYDKNGNLTGDGTWTYQYDEENRLRTASGPSTVLYDYDPLGRRRAKTVNGVTTYYTSDGAEEVAEWTGAGALTTRYLNGTSTDDHIAMLDYSSACTTGVPCRYYYHPDWHGSTMMMSNASNAVYASYHFGPYGEDPTDPTTGNPFRYTGRRLDPETGLYYYRGRYYWPGGGRFLQTDPIGSGDELNLYAYVHDDPLNNVDPMGTCTGSHIENSDGTCASSGGNTTDSAGIAQGMMKSNRVQTWAAAGAVVGGSAVAVASVPADVATGGANIPATPAEVAGGAAGGAMIGGSAGALVDKMSDEISRIIQKEREPDGEQYSLRAATTGPYPNVRGGMSQLNAGDVWKYGQTTGGRYSAAELRTLGVFYVPEFRGGQTQILIQEKLKIYVISNQVQLAVSIP